ncbi:adenylate cyclase [Stutzerimonas stutzeri]|uniref:Adenylate cyclase n=1 Tax=Stutzerimonas stutzeri TaxID=316 RepID=W8R385_STUST|nr:class I adenylate cyclase [Stutzerimonas stutzeri]AHL73988.1 adenylate cyclase [Stutzerimonas stutzeri]MCQ4328490.1 class I adenylate cyclase [Stutzerimonas stutzeri]
MTRHQEIRPILEDGIDRSVLAALRARFLSLNAARLERTKPVMSSRQQAVLTLLPLLFHVNHPILPGYVSNATPAGLSGYEPDADTLAEAQALSRSFSYKPLRGKQSQPIHGLFLMGSLGTVAQDDQSDLDVWVCHDPTLSTQQLEELQRKCDHLQAWAATQGSEAHFFLIDPVRFTQGDREAKLTSDDCGTTQHYLLLDEFYRTAIWLGGRTPLWWLVPDYEEHRYSEYARTLLDKRFVRSDEVLDLGSLATIPSGEYLGAGLWQLYKAIESPYKSLFKLLLVEVYASGHPQARCLSLDFKQAVYANRMELDELDPYIVAYRRIENYLAKRDDQERLALLRRCLYLKVNKPLSRPPTGRSKSWKRRLLERLTADWGWDERQFAQLDARGQWKVRRVVEERRALVNELTYGYRFLSELARRLQITSCINGRDFGVLGRRLHAAIERKAGKIEAINLGIAPDLAEHSLTLVQGYDAADDVFWALYEGNLNARQVSNFSPLKRSREVIPLLGWCHRNGVVDAATHVALHPGDSGLTEAELFALLTDLRQALPMPPQPVADDALLSAAAPVNVLLLLNVGLDPLSPAHPLSFDELTDSLGHGIARENLVLSIDQLTQNSWGELIATRYESPAPLAECLRDYLQALPTQGERPSLQVRCFSRNAGMALSRRVEAVFMDAQAVLDEPAQTRYLLQVRHHFHMLDLVTGNVRHTPLSDMPALLEHLGEAHQEMRPIRVDRYALEGTDLSLILGHARPHCLQVFYRVRDDMAEVTVMDEFNALWRQQQPYRDEQSLLTPLLRFLQSVSYRRITQLPFEESRLAAIDILFYRLFTPSTGRLPDIERRPAPLEEPSDPFYDIQAIVEPSERGRSQVTLYCNHQEFSSLEYGAELFAAVAHYILAQRREGERYPCYITDLDLSGLHRQGRAQTVQHLRYKAHLETALNQALQTV